MAFGDLSRLVKQSREDQEETRAYTQEGTGPHPRIRPELLDGGGNLRAQDIGITWQDGDTFLHGVWITGQRDDMEDNQRRPATGAIPAVSRGTRGRPSPTGDVDPLPTESRTPVRRHVDTGISTSVVHRDV